jgi:hypothetical protein
MYDDADFIKTLKDLHARRDVAQTIHKYGANAEAVAAVQQMGLAQGYTNDDFQVMINQPELIDDMIENTNRAWTLRERHRETVGSNLNQLMNTPSAERGELPKVKSPVEGFIAIHPQLKTQEEKTRSAADFEKAIDDLVDDAVALEGRSDEASQRRLRKAQFIIADLRASAHEPDSVNARKALQRYNLYIKEVEAS